MNLVTFSDFLKYWVVYPLSLKSFPARWSNLPLQHPAVSLLTVFFLGTNSYVTTYAWLFLSINVHAVYKAVRTVPAQGTAIISNLIQVETVICWLTQSYFWIILFYFCFYCHVLPLFSNHLWVWKRSFSVFCFVFHEPIPHWYQKRKHFPIHLYSTPTTCQVLLHADLT